MATGDVQPDSAFAFQWRPRKKREHLMLYRGRCQQAFDKWIRALIDSESKHAQQPSRTETVPDQPTASRSI